MADTDVKPAETPEDVLREALKRFDEAYSGKNESDLRQKAADDLRFVFVPGNQWDDEQRKKREAAKRPCYEFNRLRQSIRQVTGDQRQNRPQMKFRGVDAGSDKDLAETLGGLVKNIEAVSNADRAYDTAFEQAVAGGYGAWRVKTEYSDDTGWDQEIRIGEIRNPFAVLFDPHAQEWDKRDGNYAFVHEVISREGFKARFPEDTPSDFGQAPKGLEQWLMDGDVRIAEYWRRVPALKTLLLLSNGETVDKAEVEPVLDEMAADGITVVKERQVHCHKVELYIVSGEKVLSGPHAWAGKYIPLVPLWGDLVNIEGEEIYSGMVRHSRDPARSYNFHRTIAMESVARTPNAPWVGTLKMFKGLESVWQKASTTLLSYLPFNPDPEAPGARPMREAPPDVPAAVMTLAAADAEDIKATTGKHDASLGARSNETSGTAIMARQREGDTATFSYTDNLARSIKFTGEILVDLIPKIYDTSRTVRVLGEDGKEKYVTLNQTVRDQQTGQDVVVNDLSKGKFDVVVTVGPSYTTARMEAAEQLLALARTHPQLGTIVADLIVKNLDMPGSQEVEKRIRSLLIKQGIIQPGEGDEMPPPNPMQEGAAKLQLEMLVAKLVEQKLKNRKLEGETNLDELDGKMTHEETIGQRIDNLIKTGQLIISPTTGQVTAPIDQTPEIRVG